MDGPLTTDFIHECAERLGASAYSVRAILAAWHKAAKDCNNGCLYTPDGKLCFVHSRLRESDAFQVGCDSTSIRLSCDLHFWVDKDWTDREAAEFSALFIRGHGIASTKTESIRDSKPVNEVTRRAHKFPKSRLTKE